MRQLEQSNAIASVTRGGIAGPGVHAIGNRVRLRLKFGLKLKFNLNLRLSFRVDFTILL